MNRTKRSPLYLMALTILIDFAGFGVVLPLLPFWAERQGAGALGVGLILTIYALAQFIFTPVLGALSDRYGRRPIIIASLLIEALSLALSALAGSLPMLFVARFIGGLGASNIGSAQAVVADVTSVEKRARDMGLIGAAIGLGFVVGPALGGVLAPLGPTLPFWVAMSIALANALLVLRFLPETRHIRATTEVSIPMPFTNHASQDSSAGKNH
jgi:multidrug resistance protein